MNTQLMEAGILVVYLSLDRFPTIASFQHINHHHSMSKGIILITELGSTKYGDRPSKTLFSHKTNTSHRQQSTLEMNTQFSYGIARDNRFCS
ncbi:unnamed protein product [Macrosiphum euphorbiae]|uniref:Uncharacterized protein n=1 Tax=Macrosiphum euphorbiae TaxID=13131 RepID=A0AAV0XM41_9HEMI|nr:unnamed protein product [Macrosiphum euphorbiae]